MAAPFHRFDGLIEDGAEGVATVLIFGDGQRAPDVLDADAETLEWLWERREAAQEAREQAARRPDGR